MPDMNDFHGFKSTSGDSGGGGSGCGCELIVIGFIVMIVLEVLKACSN